MKKRIMCVFRSLDISDKHCTNITFSKLQASFWVSKSSILVTLAVLTIKSDLIL